MSERGRLFVESWIKEYVRPTKYEQPDHHEESRANATALLESAKIEGIDNSEIAEEFPDLIGYIAKQRESIIDRDVDRLLRKEN